MASVAIKYYPYMGKWVAEATWSNDARVYSEGSESPTDAILDLIDILKMGYAQHQIMFGATK